MNKKTAKASSRLKMRVLIQRTDNQGFSIPACQRLDPRKHVKQVEVCVVAIVSKASEPLTDEIRPAGFAAKKCHHACKCRHCVATRAHGKVLASAQERTHNHPHNSARICAPNK